MWRIICVGPWPMDRIRRVQDHGPLHGDRARVDAFADYLRSTGLYESVKVVRSALDTGAVVEQIPFGTSVDDGPKAN